MITISEYDLRPSTIRELAEDIRGMVDLYDEAYDELRGYHDALDATLWENMGEHLPAFPAKPQG